MTTAESSKPISKLPKTVELEEYTRSMRTYLATVGNSREKSPEFCWKELASVRNRQSTDTTTQTSSRPDPKSPPKKKSSQKYCAESCVSHKPAAA